MIDRLETEGGGGVAVDLASAHEPREHADAAGQLDHGSVVIAAITSCTNTSNPSVMLAAGLLAKKAAEKGLKTKPWVKASLAPGSKVVTEYFKEAGLTPYLDQLRFNLVGYGCTTCIGNSGPLPAEISKTIHDRDLVAVSVLSGNRNFEGRVNPDVRANYLASPPLVVAYALAGTMEIDLLNEPLGTGNDGQPVYLRDIWPTQKEVSDTIHPLRQNRAVPTANTRGVFEGDARWASLHVPTGDLYAWDTSSTYVKNPPYFDGMTATPPPVEPIEKARVLAVLGDSITTDHISPAGSIKKDSPAGQYLIAHGVSPADFNSYGARRGNHEVMVRGTFANIRLKNKLAPGTEGGYSRILPDGPVTSIFEASEAYQRTGHPPDHPGRQGIRLRLLARLGGQGPRPARHPRRHRRKLRAHPPLEPGRHGHPPPPVRARRSAESLGLTGEELYTIEGLLEGLKSGFASGRKVQVAAERPDGKTNRFPALVRIDTPQEIKYYQHGGILQYVLRQLVAGET